MHATDLNDDTLAVARAKTYAAPVLFERRDAYADADTRARFDAGYRLIVRCTWICDL